MSSVPNIRSFDAKSNFPIEECWRLPKDVITRIFQFFIDSRDDFITAAQVTRVVDDPELIAWHLSRRIGNPFEETFSLAIKAGSSLFKVSLFYTAIKEDHCQLLNTKCPGLTQLRIYTANLTSLPEGALAHYFTKLTHLQLEWSQGVSDKLLEKVTMMEELSSLALTACEISNQTIQALKQLKNLRELRVACCKNVTLEAFHGFSPSVMIEHDLQQRQIPLSLSEVS